MGTWKILEYSKEREKADFKVAISFQSSSYNDNGCSADTYEGSIEDSGILGLQSYQFEPLAHENDQEAGSDHNQNDDNSVHRLNNSDW